MHNAVLLCLLFAHSIHFECKVEEVRLMFELVFDDSMIKVVNRSIAESVSLNSDLQNWLYFG